jgi:ABC-2 type transport system permease protein
MSFRKIFSIFGWLLWRDLRLLVRRMPAKLFDSVLIATNFIVINTFILPRMGFPLRYGEFMWLGEVVAVSFMECSSYVRELVGDFTGTRMIEYFLTLPVPSWVIFIRLTVVGTLNCLVMSLCVLPLGKIILPQMSLINLQWKYFCLVLILINLFFGVFALWVSSWVATTLQASYFSRRLVNPLWFFGGYQFSWAILRKALPRVALFDLLNPLLYAFEGVRAAVIGQPGYIPLPIACSMLVLFCLIFAIWSWVWLKKRLDC